MSAETPRLDIRHITKRFEGKVVVDDVSLSILPGYVTCLLGPSGCGKSTTLRLIAGREGAAIESDDNKADLQRKIIEGRASRAPDSGQAPDTEVIG